MTTAILKPAEGVRVRDPRDSFRLLPSNGKRVRLTHYWLRRLKAGDVVRVEKIESTNQPQPAVEGKDEEDATN